jgi:hypothetical protein
VASELSEISDWMSGASKKDFVSWEAVGEGSGLSDPVGVVAVMEKASILKSKKIYSTNILKQNILLLNFL